MRPIRKTIKNCFLSVEGWILDLNVGYSSEERKHPQPIEIDFALFFSRPPRGCITDDLSDTICYVSCLEKVRKAVQKKPFRLIEHLGFMIHTALMEEMPAHVSARVRVKKIPPIPNGPKGVSFTYE